MAKSGAVAGLCPITEANLGDGTFPAPLFVEHGGRFGIGSDSNVLIGVADELRQLEYSQRLAHRARNVLAGAGGIDRPGAVRRGACRRQRGAWRGPPALTAGAPADFVSLDADASVARRQVRRRHPRRLDLRQRHRASTASGSRGRKLVEGGRHHRARRHRQRFRKTMLELAAA